MDIHLEDILATGKNYLSLSEQAVSFHDCNFDKMRLKITVYYHDGSVWSNGMQFGKQAVFNLARPERTDITTVTDLKSRASGMMSKYLGCFSSNIGRFISPGIEEIAEKYNQNTLTSWMDTAGGERTRKLKALILEFLWGLVPVYPEIMILKVPGKEQEVEFVFYFKPTIDPYCTIGLSYSLEYPSIELSGENKVHRLIWLPKAA